jgi:hypothetical protein
MATHIILDMMAMFLFLSEWDAPLAEGLGVEGCSVDIEGELDDEGEELEDVGGTVAVKELEDKEEDSDDVDIKVSEEDVVGVGGTVGVVDEEDAGGVKPP